MKERVYALDLLRAFMMLLGVLLHLLIFNPQLPVIGTSWSNKIALLVSEFIQAFRMPLFFCLSGFLSALLYGKAGPAGFVLNRMKRLFFPFVLAVLTIGILCNLLYTAIANQRKMPTEGEDINWKLIVSEYDYANVEPIHLWFLYYLLMFVALAFLGKLIASRFRGGLRILSVNWIKQLSPIRIKAGAILFSLPFVYLLWTGGYLGSPPYGSFSINTGFFLFYFYFFVFGWILFSSKIELACFIPGAKFTLMLGFLMTACKLLLWSLPGKAAFLLMLTASGLSVWFYIFGFLGLAQMFVRKSSPGLQYLVDSSYWIYLAHLPIILALKVAFPKPVSLQVFLLLAAIVTTGCFFSYHYLVRPTLLGHLLNGKTKQVRPLSEVFGTLFEQLKVVEKLKLSRAAVKHSYRRRNFS